MLSCVACTFTASVAEYRPTNSSNSSSEASNHPSLKPQLEKSQRTLHTALLASLILVTLKYVFIIGFKRKAPQSSMLAGGTSAS